MKLQRPGFYYVQTRAGRDFTEGNRKSEKSLDFYRQRITAGLDDNISFARQNVVYDQLKLEEARSLRELEIIKIRLSSLMGQPLNTNFRR